MRRSRALVLLALLAALPGAAGAQGARIHMHGDAPYAADGLLYTPPGSGEVAALLLIPGEAGITPGTQAAAESLLAAGYEVVVLDPNRSGPPGQVGDADQWADVQSALSFLAGQSNLKRGHIAAVGFGRGARLALRLARERRVKAVIVEAAARPAAPDLASPVPVLLELAAAQGAASPSGGVETRVHPRGPAPADDANLFPPAELGRVREEELAFLRRALPDTP